MTGDEAYSGHVPGSPRPGTGKVFILGDLRFTGDPAVCPVPDRSWSPAASWQGEEGHDVESPEGLTLAEVVAWARAQPATEWWIHGELVGGPDTMVPLKENAVLRH